VFSHWTPARKLSPHQGCTSRCHQRGPTSPRCPQRRMRPCWWFYQPSPPRRPAHKPEGSEASAGGSQLSLHGDWRTDLGKNSSLTASRGFTARDDSFWHGRCFGVTSKGPAPPLAPYAGRVPARAEDRHSTRPREPLGCHTSRLQGTGGATRPPAHLTVPLPVPPSHKTQPWVPAPTVSLPSTAPRGQTHRGRRNGAATPLLGLVLSCILSGKSQIPLSKKRKLLPGVYPGWPWARREAARSGAGSSRSAGCSRAFAPAARPMASPLPPREKGECTDTEFQSKGPSRNKSFALTHLPRATRWNKGGFQALEKLERKTVCFKTPSPPARGRGGKEKLMYSQLVRFLQSVPPLILPLHRHRSAPRSGAAKQSKRPGTLEEIPRAGSLLPGSPGEALRC